MGKIKSFSSASVGPTFYSIHEAKKNSTLSFYQDKLSLHKEESKKYNTRARLILNLSGEPQGSLFYSLKGVWANGA